MSQMVASRFARQRAGAIRQGMRDYLKTLALIKEAWDQRDWDALGYTDWQSYVDGEFGAERLGLTPQHRQKAVEELRLAGMSTRAIGAALGTSEATVRRELTASSDAVMPERVKGLDGREQPATRPTDSPAGRADTGRADQPGAETPRDGGIGGVGVTRDAGTDAAPRPTQSAADPIDDPEQIEAQRREMSSKQVAEGLVWLSLALDPDPVRWLTNTWAPDAYKLRDLPRVREVFTPSGLHGLADHLHKLADHLDVSGGTL